jgi:hypothetical protein
LHIIRRTRSYLENTIDPATGEPYPNIIFPTSRLLFMRVVIVQGY